MSAVRTLAVIAGFGAFGAAGCGGGDSGLPADAPPGQRVWADTNCGSCHVLADADSTGQVGGNLDKLRPSAATVERWVREGGQGMPAFAGQLSDQQVRDVAQYVARVAGR